MLPHAITNYDVFAICRDLVEPHQHNLLSRALQRWTRFDLIVLDEVGPAPFAQVGADLLFQEIVFRNRASLPTE
jgi:hypothetical protein